MALHIQYLIIKLPSMESSSRSIEQQFSKTLINKFYKIGNLMSQGGFGYVFYGEDIYGKPKAIKIIDMQKLEESKNQKQIQLINYEPQAMKACDNPHIMRCENVFQCSKLKVKIIIMDYCEYGSLEDLIFLRGRIPEWEAKITLKQILYALGDFHRHGLIHRDMKSANILGKADSIIMCDFGCSKLFLDSNQQNNWRKTYRQQGTILGTRCCMSPQMLKGQQYGYRADLWGVGIILYEMITGTSPFYFKQGQTDKTMYEVIKATIGDIFNEKYIAKKLKDEELEIKPSQCKISSDALQMLKKLLQIDQKKRYGWQDLLNHPYLIGNPQEQSTQYYERPDCSFPLKNINWSQVSKDFREDLQESNVGTKKLNIKSNTLPILNFEKLQKLQSITIQNNEQTIYCTFLNNVTMNRQLHFEVRRLHLILSARHQLTNFDPSKIKLAVSLSNYCQLKCQLIIEKYKTKVDKIFFDCYELAKLLQEKIKPLAKGDRQDLQGLGHGVAHEWYIWAKKIFRGRQASKDFSQLLSSDNFQHTCQIVQHYSKTLCEDLTKQQKQKLRKFKNLQCLTQNPKAILQCSYTPQIKPQNRQIWKTWNNLKEIIEQYQVNQH